MGIHWSTERDSLHVTTPRLNSEDPPTKRQLASDVARTFDILGLFAPATLTVKILLQKLWSLKLDWDNEIPNDLANEWRRWRRELPCITEFPLPRCYFHPIKKKLILQTHEFSDASQTAYGGVMYIRTIYTDTSTEVRLIMAKTKVAPISGATIPRLELCAALLMDKLLDFV